MSSFVIRQTAKLIHAGAVIGYPTEAVYGLGCHPLDYDAVLRILDIKQRSISKGLILIAADFRQLRPYVADAPADKLQKAFDSWPGPHTWLFPKNPATPFWLTGDYDTIAVRVSAHPVVQKLCMASGTALVSTSANRSQQQPARSALECHLKCPEVDFIVSGDVNRNARPSTIKDLLTDTPIRI